MQTEIRPWLQDRPILVLMLRAVMYAGFANFIAFIAVDILIGGDALAGDEDDGRYFLSSHGRLTEVSQAVFVYSKWHATSIWITHPLAIAAIVVLHGFHFGRDKSTYR